MTTSPPFLVGSVIASSLLMTPALMGAGFQLQQRSATGQGRAFSGEAAYAEDASVLASNPAAMIMLGGEWNYSAGVVIVDVESEVNGFGPFGGLSDGSSGGTSFIPLVYGTKRVNENLVVGLGAFSTYGLVTDYSTSFADQSATDRSEIITVNVNPSFAYRLNDVVTIGAGFNILYAEGTLTSRTPGGFGTLFRLDGDDVGFGYNVGALFEVSDRINIGVHYRSKVDIELEGDAFLGGAFAAATEGAQNFDGSLDIELPATAEISLLFRATDKLDLHADIFWTNWDQVSRLSPRVSGTFADSVRRFSTQRRFGLGKYLPLRNRSHLPLL